MNVAPLEDMNRKAEDTLHEVARNIHGSSLMSRYTEELTKIDREKWQLSEIDKAMMKGGDKACEYIERKAESHLARLMSRMEWFPVAYHLVDKAALVVFLAVGCENLHTLRGRIFVPSLAPKPALRLFPDAP